MAMLASGVVLIIAAGLALPLPVPAGAFLFAGGMVLILRNSVRARIRWARAKRRWPRAGNLVDRTMRRQSALRRQQRGKARRIDTGRTDATARTDERSMR
ncbi:hypothetical protein [Sphingomonas sp. Leaf17]|uniref:hypothetical protein n=1 Tax=Sphingomonas sp. Leaf17 TaxID=1735683 RepID=UPI0012E11FE8|nr:hypothetical protein [Sphingomonas sp. Leaf17]